MNRPSLSALWTLLTTDYGVVLIIAVSLVIWRVRTTIIRFRFIPDHDNRSMQPFPQVQLPSNNTPSAPAKVSLAAPSPPAHDGISLTDSVRTLPASVMAYVVAILRLAKLDSREALRLGFRIAAAAKLLVAITQSRATSARTP
jgi:hypothetical protein